MGFKIVKPPSLTERVRMIPSSTRQAFEEIDAAEDFLRLFNKDNRTNYRCEKNKASIAPDINVYDNSKRGLAFGLELMEVNISLIRRYAGIEDKWRRHITGILQTSLDETKLKTGYRISVYIEEEPTRKLLERVGDCCSNLFSKLLVSGGVEIEERRPAKGVEFIKIHEWDSRKQIGVTLNLSLFKYYSENESADLYQLLHNALLAKSERQAYDKHILLYFPRFDSGIHFEEPTFVKACKKIKLSDYNNIQNAYIMIYHPLCVDSCKYFDIGGDKSVS